MKRLIAIFSILTFLLISLTPNVALTAPSTKFIKINEKAPFSGLLLNNEAAIENKVRFETIAKLHAKEIEKTQAIINADYNAKLATLNVRLEHQKLTYEAELSFKDREIDFIKKNFNPPGFFESFTGGIVVGVVATFITVIGTGYALGQISK